VSESLATYLQAISRYPLLSAQREILLAKQVQALPALRRIPPQQRTCQHQRQLRAAERAQQAMVNCNLRLVVSLAKAYRADHLSLQDLIQEGNLGLLRAVEKYDPTLGYRFSTYAGWWIRQTIVRAIANQDRTIRIPGHTNALLRKVRAAAERLGRGGVENPSLSLIALEAGLNLEAVARSLELSRKVQSLDAASHLDGACLLDLVAADAVDAYERLDHGIELKQLQTRLGGLTDLERAVLHGRYLCGQLRRPEQVGEELGVAPTAVRLAEKRAIRRLRQHLRDCRSR
jgi:RNA polymerase sigma factor (sigma-70 family)